MEKYPLPAKGSRQRRIASVASLTDPGRMALYDLVSRSTGPVSRDAAAAAAGLPRSTAAFHLDRLAEEGLLEVEYRRLSGKTGPGSGRPAKLYRRADTEVSVSLPERHYGLAGDLLATAIERSTDTGAGVREILGEVAEDAGRSIGAHADSLLSALQDNGFEPIADGKDIVLGTCPFHLLAQKHTNLVCELNRELVRGIRTGSGDACCQVLSDPGAGGCCIRITNTPVS